MKTCSKFKQKLIKKQKTIGSWLTFSDPAIAEIMAKSGFDWIVIDMEHSSLSFNQAQEMIRIIDLCGTTPLVRVIENNHDLIKRYMDAGAHGVIVPMVNSKEEAIKAVNAVKYPPIGGRGVGLSRAQNYGLEFDEYYNWNQDNSIVIVQIEDIKGLQNIESIMSVNNLDGLIVGPYDLSASLGHPGDFDNALVKEAFQNIKTQITNSEKPWGFHVVDPDIQTALDKFNEGYTFLAFGVDFLYFSKHCRDKVDLLSKKL